MEEFTSYLAGQPLGIAALILLIFGLVFEYIVTGRAYRRALDTIQTQQQTIEQLAESVEKLADSQDLTLEVIQGIDRVVRHMERP